METQLCPQLIERYIQAYNTMDVEGMLATLHSDITFQNISNGELNLTTRFIKTFKTWAGETVHQFRERKQTIIGMNIKDSEADVQNSCTGIVAHDLPKGWKAGDRIELTDKSILRFRDNKISSITAIN
jgi:ketosteroid isomerase-like protein